MNSNNFFQLVADFQKNIDWLNQILKGGDADSVLIDGVLKPSISKDIADKWAAISAMVKGRLAYETKAEMDQAGAPPSGTTLAQVWNDPARENNGLYGWDGAQWLRSKYDDVSELTKDMEEAKGQIQWLAKSLLMDAGLYQYAGNKSSLVPLALDENNKAALQLDGENGQLFFEPHYLSMLLGAGHLGIFADQSSDKNVSFAIIDENKKIAFGLDNNGFPLAGTFGQPIVHREILPSKQSVDAEINHFLFSGQSLSVGAAGLPAITMSQPYTNITFAGGPRSDLDELTSFKPLFEDENLAPDGGSNRGETQCSGAANFVTELIQSEQGLSYTDHHYDMLSSTVGHGGYTIRQLNKGSAWYQYLEAHIQAGFDLSVSQNKSFAVQAIGWLQGENDQYQGEKPRLEYKDDLIQYQKDVQADVQAVTGQSHRVPLLTYQLAAYVRNGGNYRNVTLAQLDAAEEQADIYMVCPMYHVPYAGDRIHLTNVGYKYVGHYFGKVYKRVVYEGMEWTPLSPKVIRSQGKVVSVEFNVPEPPLVIDDQTLNLTKDYGFAVSDDTGQLAIESVEVVGSTRLKIVVDRVLTTNPRLRYGLDYTSSGNTPRDGGSGNLRDSDPLFWLHEGEKKPLYNWCVMFDKAID
jgi:hypothetical protein